MIYCLAVLILAIEVLHFKERQKLLDRIQAKDYVQYKVYEEKPKKQEKKEEKKEYNFL